MKRALGAHDQKDVGGDSEAGPSEVCFLPSRPGRFRSTGMATCSLGTCLWVCMTVRFAVHCRLDERKWVGRSEKLSVSEEE